MHKYAIIHEHREGLTTYFFQCDNGPTIMLRALNNKNRATLITQLEIPFDGDRDFLTIEHIDADNLQTVTL